MGKSVGSRLYRDRFQGMELRWRFRCRHLWFDECELSSAPVRETSAVRNQPSSHDQDNQRGMLRFAGILSQRNQSSRHFRCRLHGRLIGGDQGAINALSNSRDGPRSSLGRRLIFLFHCRKIYTVYSVRGVILVFVSLRIDNGQVHPDRIDAINVGYHRARDLSPIQGRGIGRGTASLRDPLLGVDK